ncbi:unnamed protein product [Ectocarpus sp. 6 AP-2014]
MQQQHRPAAVSRRMWASSLISALPSFLFGYCLSALNTVLVTGDAASPGACLSGEDATCPTGSTLRDLDLPTVQQEVATSLLVAGAWLGSMMASRPSDALGRRATLLYNNALFIAGGLLCAVAVGSSELFVGRFLAGMGVGCGSGVVPVLLSEVSSPKNRGAVGSIHQLMINLGILSSGLLGYALVEDVPHGWRYVQGFIVVPAAVQLALAGLVPESARWLVKQGRIAEAKAVLRKLHGGGGAGGAGGGQTDDEIGREVDGMGGNKGEEHKGNVSWAEVFAYRRPVMIGVLLMLIQAFTGINTVVFYSTTIFELAGVDNTVLATVSVGLTLVVMTSVSGSLVDKAGRRSLMLIGTLVMALALAILSGSLLWLNATPRAQGCLAVAATLLFISGFSLGQGSVCWILLTEIVPSRIRAQAFSIFTAINWLSNLFIGLFTLSAIDAMGEWLLPSSGGGSSSPSARDQQKVGVAGLYAVFCVLSVLAVAFIYFFVRETMGKSLEELEEGGGGGGSAGGGSADRLAFDVGGAREGLGDDSESTNALLQLSEHGGADDEDGEGACRVLI